MASVDELMLAWTFYNRVKAELQGRSGEEEVSTLST
jgi:hypothetical protein